MKIKAIFFDLGDTLMDETTEVKDQNLVTIDAELVDGAKELLIKLKEMNYKVALVADTRIGTYKNVLGKFDMFKYFDCFAISEELGVQKPDPKIFLFALKSLGIEERDYKNVIMVGNNLKRDIVGANRLGLISVWFHWNDRYPSKPENNEEIPNFEIKRLSELLEVIKRLEGEI
ncbi:HAD-IA family hydrolase [bacterium]|nr:HAD-IA family hydrolase [bacterium]